MSSAVSLHGGLVQPSQLIVLSFGSDMGDAAAAGVASGEGAAAAVGVGSGEGAAAAADVGSGEGAADSQSTALGNSLPLVWHGRQCGGGGYRAAVIGL